MPEEEEEKEGWEHPLGTHLVWDISIFEGTVLCLQPEGHTSVLTAMSGHPAAPVLCPQPSENLHAIVLRGLWEAGLQKWDKESYASSSPHHPA